MDEVFCDVSPLEVCDILLGQPYLWKRHVVYESRLHFVIISLGTKLYRILEVAPPTAISLISAKKCYVGEIIYVMIPTLNYQSESRKL